MRILPQPPGLVKNFFKFFFLPASRTSDPPARCHSRQLCYITTAPLTCQPFFSDFSIFLLGPAYYGQSALFFKCCAALSACDPNPPFSPGNSQLHIAGGASENLILSSLFCLGLATFPDATNPTGFPEKPLVLLLALWNIPRQGPVDEHPC